MKICARQIGVSVEEYAERVRNGEKWCLLCREWQSRELFSPDRSRGDGLATACKDARNRWQRKRYVLKGPPAHHGPLPGTFKHTEEVLRKIKIANQRSARMRRGVKLSIETRKLISKTVRERAARGPQCHSYKDGKADERRGLRFSLIYKRWRYDVFSRDHFTCQRCEDKRGGNLVAHHIKAFAEYPELRFDISNGLTLCKPCHKKIHARKEE